MFRFINIPVPRYSRFMPRLAALLCLCMLQAGCNDGPPSMGEVPQVRYTTVAPEHLVLTSELPGRVAALVTAEVRPQVDGIIQQRLFEEGAPVTKGQVLYQIDPAAYEAARNTAKAELEEALVHAAAQQKREARARVLAKANAVSQQEWDDTVAEHGKAKARVARAKAALETAEINLNYTSIKAPVSGRIGRSAVTQGALVTANQTGPLAVIQQINQVYVDITQSNASMLRLRRLAAALGPAWGKGTTGARLILEDGTPYAVPGSEHGEPQWHKGDLLFAEISVAQTTGSVSMRALFPNPEGLLLPGMYARVLIEEGSIENALLIPQRAVMADGEGRHFVLTLQEPETSAAAKSAALLFTVQKKSVELDRPFGNRWLVRSGLEAGDLVIVEGIQKAAAEGKAIGEQTPDDTQDSGAVQNSKKRDGR
ncbi:MAG: efflux RND transporter periplasmic adaptor subunit [Desulfovibrio sp.]|uniref:efflux RND transporter periplasmic adaptor subunit n=1 Tax=Desulfovibrio sp. TaxID=885 RepID=UPI0039E34B30